MTLDDDSVRNMFTDSFDSIDQWKKGETPAHAVKSLRIVCEVVGKK